MGKTCQICGRNSGMYPLCTKHLKMKDEGKVIKCPNCGTWHLKEDNCKCQKQIQYTELPSEGFTNCILCGAETDGYAYCRNCWQKYTYDELLQFLNNPFEINKEKISFRI